MAEWVDAVDLKSTGHFMSVPVQVRPPAPNLYLALGILNSLFASWLGNTGYLRYSEVYVLIFWKISES